MLRLHSGRHALFFATLVHLLNRELQILESSRAHLHYFGSASDFFSIPSLIAQHQLVHFIATTLLPYVLEYDFVKLQSCIRAALQWLFFRY